MADTMLRTTGTMPGRVRLALAQINPTVGDLEANGQKIIEYIGQARTAGADIVVFPELAITGYPPEDLLLKPGFLQANLRALEKVIAATEGITAVVGFVDVKEDIYNAAAVIHNRQLAGVHHTFFLPNYGVFDENRYFQSGTRTAVYGLGPATVGVVVCEDIWYPEGPARAQSLVGDAEIVISINSSPFYAGKWSFREKMLTTRASDNTAVVVYLNAVGGQDELVFDGHSLVVAPDGEVLARGKAFEEELVLVDVDAARVLHARLEDPRRRKVKLGFNGEQTPVDRISLGPIAAAAKPPLPERNVQPPGRLEEIYKALVLGTRDYVNKNNFKRVVFGLSGGIDSALVAAIAVDALGKERVVAVTMPSQFTSTGTLSDAEKIAANLDIELITLPIHDVFEAYKKTLKPAFGDRPEDVTEENIQARIRGNFLMALSNKFGWLVLTTGNKSEMAAGYATLYGDMAGGFAVIKDVPKTVVYELARYRNERGPVIPESVITRPPSAELRPGQTDQDTLPPYPVLDAILKLYVEEDRSFEEIVALGHDEQTVRRVLRMVDRNEYKRRQAPPGVKITPKAFGKDRRLPITNHYSQ